MNIPTKFGSNWPNGFREGDWYVKLYGQLTQNNGNTSHDRDKENSQVMNTGN